MKWARIDENNLVCEIISYDPTGLFNPSLIWYQASDDVKYNDYYDASSKSFKTLSDTELNTINWSAKRQKAYLEAWSLEAQSEAILDKMSGNDVKYNQMLIDFAAIKAKYPKPTDVQN